MPKYVIEREVGPEMLSKEQQKNSGEVLKEMPEVTWVKSHVSEAEGKIYCEYDAPNPEAIQDHAKKAGIPADKINKISAEVSPDMFM